MKYTLENLILLFKNEVADRAAKIDPSRKNMQITIDIDSREAEAILFSLALRSKQRGISDNYTRAAVDVGERLNKVFEKSFAWDEFDRMKHMRKPIKSVSVKCYDFAPE